MSEVHTALPLTLLRESSCFRSGPTRFPKAFWCVTHAVVKDPREMPKISLLMGVENTTKWLTFSIIMIGWVRLKKLECRLGLNS